MDVPFFPTEHAQALAKSENVLWTHRLSAFWSEIAVHCSAF